MRALVSQHGPDRARARLLPGLGASSGRRLILWITLAYILLSGIFLGGALLLLRHETIASSEQVMRAFARVAEEQATRTVQGIDGVLLEARRILADLSAKDPANEPAVQAALGKLLLARPFLRSIWILDADGRIVFNSSERYVGTNVSDRPFFRHYKERPERDFAIHAPVRARATGQWYMTFTRSWRHADGTFAGVILATPERHYFERVWNADDIGENGSVALFRRDGILLIRSPYLESALGKSFADSPVFGKLIDEGAAGTQRDVTVVDDRPRLVSYRALSAYPDLLIVVGQTLDRVLAPWRRYAWIAFASWGIGSTAAGIIIALLLVSLRSSDRTLRSALALNQRIFETSVDLILVMNRDGTLVQVSPSALAIMGYTPDEMIGRNIGAFIEAADGEHGRDAMRLARRGRALRNFECRYRHKDGRVVVLVWGGVWSAAAQLHFFIGRDMTEQHAIEEQLRQAQKLEAVGQLTGGIAHDFNNMLTVIIGNAEMLVEEVGPASPLHPLCAMILQVSERSAELTAGLLAFARRQSLRPQRVEVNPYLTGLQGLLRRTLGENIEIKLILPETAWEVMIDRAQLETAIVNLAINARDAMPGGGRLTIETANAQIDTAFLELEEEPRIADFVMVAVSDNGTGMPPETMRRVFEPFFTTKEPGKGTGLGLSMVYGFVRQSGGNVKVYSEPGQGTTVKMYLPRATGPAERAVTAAAKAPAATANGEVVLVVEDNDLVRDHVTSQLRAIGYRVIAAASGADALKILADEGRLDLLFTDMVMPGGLSGRDVAERARALRPGIRVLFTSGYTQDAVVHAGRLDPEVNLLSKPYHLRELAEKVRTALDGR